MRKFIMICLSIIVVFFIVYSFRYRRINYDTDKSKIVKEYFDKEYNTSSNVRQLSFIGNKKGFTGGLYQYSFSIVDIINSAEYKGTYMEYEDISEDTVERIKIIKK